MIYSQAIKITRNPEEAEDITQEVFLKSFEKLSTFKGESAFSTWIFKIGQNLALERQRKLQKITVESPNHFEELENSSSFSTSPENSPESLVLKKEISQTLKELLSRLPMNYKNPLLLYYFENMSYLEISEKMGVKLNTIKSYILRGKELLKGWLQNEKTEN
jgi:RNA polymerase sigma-70 factor (ECF subfamily)